MHREIGIATCLRMCSTPEKDNIESKLMRVEAMTQKGEVSFAEECKRLLDLRDEIGLTTIVPYPWKVAV